MVGELLDLVTRLSGVSDRLQQAEEKKRQRIANYFLDIEKCLQESVEILKKEEVPNKNLGELRVYARDLSNIIGEEIGEDVAEELASHLSNTSSKIPTIEDIPKIENAAGQFKGLANTITTKDKKKFKRLNILVPIAFGIFCFIVGFFIQEKLSPSPKENTISSPKVKPPETIPLTIPPKPSSPPDKPLETSQPTPPASPNSPEPNFSADPKLAQLNLLLKEKKWQEADQETFDLILEDAQIKSGDDSEEKYYNSIKKFNCQLLKDIDQLWTKNSSNQFGFSVQKRIYFDTEEQISR